MRTDSGRACRELSERLGFDPREVWRAFIELADMAEIRARYPRSVAEWVALRLLNRIYDKQGQGHDQAS